MGRTSVHRAGVLLNILTLTTVALRSVAAQGNVVSGSKADFSSCMQAAVQLPEIEWKRPVPSPFISVEWTYGNVSISNVTDMFRE